MNPEVIALIDNLKAQKTAFSEVLCFIDNRYQHQPTAFKNGETYNDATQNQGSARVFGFARLNQLSKEDTLYLFAEHYQSVLTHSDATDHQNIRQFMQYGWKGLTFEGEPLISK